MLKVRVKYISLLADLTGKREETVEVPEGITLEEFIRIMGRKYPQLGELNKKYQIIGIINDLITDSSRRLNPGDKVVIMPPASGG